MRFALRIIPAMLLAVTLFFSPAAVRDAAAYGNCTESWESCSGQATIDGYGDYRGEWAAGTLGEDVECAFEYAGCLIRKLRFW